MDSGQLSSVKSPCMLLLAYATVTIYDRYDGEFLTWRRYLAEGHQAGEGGGSWRYGERQSGDGVEPSIYLT